MAADIATGIVIFTGNRSRLADFYQAITGLEPHYTDDQVTVLRSSSFELVIHALDAEPPTAHPPLAREDSYLKPFFPVKSLSETRQKAAELGGRLQDEGKEWEARGFRACEATDPDGNVIQFREARQ